MASFQERIVGAAKLDPERTRRSKPTPMPSTRRSQLLPCRLSLRVSEGLASAW